MAGELAGLKVERLLNEPTAAALAYGLHNKESETKFLIFDLGGGTFDVSIVELFSGVIEVCSSAGDNRLGGEDFIDALEGFIKMELSRLYEIESDEIDADIQTRWRDQVKKMMHQLSDKQEAHFQITHNDKLVDIPVTRDQFDAQVQPLIERLKLPLEKALRDARILPENLDLVILVGGATRIPIVGIEVAKMFGKFPQSILHPDEAIALGAAVQAALKERHQDLKDVVITDVCPYSLGTDVLQKGKHRQVKFLPIIERNTTIPTSRVARLCTSSDNQTGVTIPVYQGESFNVDDNIKIGELYASVPPRPSGEESFDVRYTYDINGLLEVEVTVISTGKKTRLTVDNQNHQLTEAEIATSLEKLKDLKIHPRDQLENRKIAAELENLFSLFKGDERDAVGDATCAFFEALDSQEPAIIKEAKEEAIDFISSYKSLF